jgi:hypothetical protein
MTSHDPQPPAAVGGRHSDPAGATAPRKRLFLLVPAVLLLGILAVILGGVGTRNHDDPIVIDNSPIFVSRPGIAEYPEAESGSSPRWSLRKMDRLDHMRVVSKDGGGTPHPLPGDYPTLRGIGDITFKLMDKDGRDAHKAFVVRRDAFWERPFFQHVRARPEANAFRFVLDGRRLTPWEHPDLHVAEIAFGDTTICLADDPVPTRAACAQWDYMPATLEIKLCANAACTSSHPPSPDSDSARNADEQAFTNHDDPIVIDNKKIEIHRKKHKPKMVSSNKKWSLDHMADIVHLEVTTRHGGQPTTLVKDFPAIETFKLDLVDGTQHADTFFTIFREGVAGHEQATVESNGDDLEFDHDDPSNPKKVKDKKLKLSIGQIAFGNSFICLAKSNKAEDGPCGNTWDKLPDSVEIKLCGNKECEATKPR